VALTASVLCASLALGCFFELAELEDPLSGVGGAPNGGAGAGAGAGGGEAAGNSSVGGNGVGCPLGQKNCGSGCVTRLPENGCADLSCTPCAPLPQASVSCSGDTNLCKFEACDVGFADCNADTSGYNGTASSSDGCEYAFGPGGVIVPVAPEQLQVPLASININDDSRDDWAGAPAYPLVATCDNCVDDALPDVTNKNEVPARSDLDAYFRVAWDQDFFYVLADVFDSALVANGADNSDGRCQNGALCEDAMTVFFDGRNNRLESPGYNIDDSRVFIGLGGNALRVSGSLQPQQVDLKPKQHGPACYRIEAQFSWSFIVGVQGNAAQLAGQFPPAEGQQYGFDISVNDWDPGVSDQTPRRESQLFWKNPGADYQRVTSGFGPIRLSAPVPPAGAPR
jgi:Carbohydrate family 9 binding domain-like